MQVNSLLHKYKIIKRKKNALETLINHCSIEHANTQTQRSYASQCLADNLSQFLSTSIERCILSKVRFIKQKNPNAQKLGLELYKITIQPQHKEKKLHIYLKGENVNKKEEMYLKKDKPQVHQIIQCMSTNTYQCIFCYRRD